MLFLARNVGHLEQFARWLLLQVVHVGGVSGVLMQVLVSCCLIVVCRSMAISLILKALYGGFMRFILFPMLYLYVFNVPRCTSLT